MSQEIDSDEEWVREAVRFTSELQTSTDPKILSFQEDFRDAIPQTAARFSQSMRDDAEEDRIDRIEFVKRKNSTTMAAAATNTDAGHISPSPNPSPKRKRVAEKEKDNTTPKKLKPTTSQNEDWHEPIESEQKRKQVETGRGSGSTASTHSSEATVDTSKSTLFSSSDARGD